MDNQTNAGASPIPSKRLPFSRFAIASLLISLFTFVIPYAANLRMILYVLSIILGIVGLKKIKKGLMRGKPLAIIGIILSSISLLSEIIASIVLLSLRK